MLLLGACGSTALDEYEICTIDVTTVSPTSAAPGAEVSVTGTPLTEVRDTRIEVGGVRATVDSVLRDGCEPCDICRDDANCAPCGLCAGLALTAAARDTCFGDPLADPPLVGDCAACVESLVFVVPEVAPGLTTALIVNRNGQSLAIPFEVLPATTDTAASDTAAP